MYNTMKENLSHFDGLLGLCVLHPCCGTVASYSCIVGQCSSASSTSMAGLLNGTTGHRHQGTQKSQGQRPNNYTQTLNETLITGYTGLKQDMSNLYKYQHYQKNTAYLNYQK